MNFAGFVNSDVINTFDQSVKLKLDSRLLRCSWLAKFSSPIVDTDVQF